MNGKKVLFLATVDSHIYYFHVPFMKLLKEMGYEVEVGASNVGFTDRIEKAGFKVYNIPFSRNPLNPKNIIAFAVLLRLMKKRKYLMLHTHTPVASFLGRIAGRIAEIPHIVYTAHGFHFHEYGNPLTNFLYFTLEKFAGKFTDVLITINTDDYKIAKEKKFAPNGRVVYIKGVGVDTERFNHFVFDNFKEASITNDGKVKTFIFIGRLEREKHVDHILKAFYLVSKENKNFNLLVLGDGKLGKELQSLSKKLSLTDRIYFLGKLDDVRPYLLNSFGFILTSSREGLPKSLMEAMAMEKPVVAYNIRGVRDLVEDGVNGFLVKFGDVNELAKKITYLMEHPDIAKIMGKKGREKIEKEFSLKIILRDMEKLYKEILEDR